MNYTQTRWTILPEKPFLQSLLQKELNLSPLLSQLLVNREITQLDAAKKFLSSSLNDLTSPFLMKDLKKASRRVIEAIYQKEKICIFGDYDVDGITGTAILKLFLDSVGADVSFYIPERLTEGYGLNVPALEKIRALGTVLVITVDCGISDYDQILFARDQGMDVIITDHHEVPEKIPFAYAVINPKQAECSFPFKHLAGVGVAFYLIIGLRKLLREEGFWSQGSPPNLKEYLDLVALGTVADIVPLIEENRIFVKQGLEVIETTRRVGLQALKKISGVDNIPISPVLISYRLAPKINVCGRLGQAGKGVALLITKDQVEAEQIARELDEENGKRQQLESAIFKDACRMIEELGQWQNQKVFVLGSPDWHRGVVGIGASRVVDRYYRPTILISFDGNFGHGSARSIEAFHIYDGLKDCQDLLERFGGHEYAAGLTIAQDNVGQLRERLNDLVEKTLRPDDFVPKLYIDAQVNLAQIKEALVHEIATLAPYGADNPEPLFVSDVLFANNSKIVGNGHLKFRLGGLREGIDAIGFGLGSLIPEPETPVRVVFIPEINHWQGTKNLRIKMKDIEIIDQ
jgi:single-stranded-DNA-specific exonuclease